MAWDGSAVFTAFTAGAITPAEPVRSLWIDAQTSGRARAAVFSTVVTPNRAAVFGATFYGQGEWTPDREVTGAGWAARGGQVQVAIRNDPSGSLGLFNTLPLSAGGVTLRGACGSLFFDNTTDLGMCFHDFGGTVNVDAGTFTLTWPPAGIIVINTAVP